MQQHRKGNFKRLKKQHSDILSDPPHNQQAWPINQELNHWRGIIYGPQDSPYQNGMFFLDIKIPNDYPFKPPKVIFKTPIFHPGVDSNGNMSFSFLQIEWSPAYKIIKVLKLISNKLVQIDTDFMMDVQIGTLLMNGPAQFQKIAKEQTLKFA